MTVSTPIRNEDEEIIGIFAADIKFEELLKMMEEDLGGTKRQRYKEERCNSERYPSSNRTE